MAATFHSIEGKVLIVAVAIAMLLCSTGYAQEAPVPPSPPLPPIDTPPSPAYKYPPCEALGLSLPECQSWCNKIGFHGGYLKVDVCCCNG